jgi:hypothetical protein
MKMILDTWTGEAGRVVSKPRVRQEKSDDYRNIKLPAPPIERGAPVLNPPKPPPIAHWMIGFEGATSRAFAALHCSCKTVTHFELGGLGVAPVAKCCKNAPPYPQNRKYTAHLLATGVEPDVVLGGGVVAQPGFLLEPGTRIGDTSEKPQTEITFNQDEEFINRLVKADMAGAAKDAEVIEAAYKAQSKKK